MGSQKGLLNVVDNKSIKEIRPHKVFGLVKSKTGYERMVKLSLSELRSPLLIETTLMIALAKVVKPKKFFEFGTFLGVRTLNIGENLPSSSILYTLDLDEESFKKANQLPRDERITLEHFEGEDRLSFFGATNNERYIRLFGDSNVYDFSEYYSHMGMIFIDGGHDLVTVKSDTENSLKMISDDDPACIVWHDYTHPEYPDVKEYLEKFAEDNSYTFYHIAGTVLCFYLKNVGQEIIEDLNNGLRPTRVKVNNINIDVVR